MRRGLLGVAVAIALIGGALLLMGGPQQALRAPGDARALAALPQVPVAPMLALPEGAPDLVVFEDGDAGWFALDLAALPPGLEIGMHGPRFLDVFTGNTHLPLYCGGESYQPGKIIWMIHDAQIARDFAFCNRRRMDLEPLHPFAEAVTMTQANLTQAEVEALDQRISADQTVNAVTLPTEFQPFTHHRVIEAPFHWTHFGPGRSTLPLRDALLQAVATHLGSLVSDAEITVNERNVSFLTDTMGYEDRPATHAMGAGIVVDGGSVILPDVAISRFRIIVTCSPAACDALGGFDAAPLLDAFRSAAELDDALAAALPIARNPDDLMPSPEDLRDRTTTLTETAPLTYSTRYIERP